MRLSALAPIPQRIAIAGDPKRVTKWLGGERPATILEGLDVEWVAPHGTPGVVAAHFQTASGLLTVTRTEDGRLTMDFPGSMPEAMSTAG